jgi:hypothetical protein
MIDSQTRTRGKRWDTSFTDRAGGKKSEYACSLR